MPNMPLSFHQSRSTHTERGEVCGEGEGVYLRQLSTVCKQVLGFVQLLVDPTSDAGARMFEYFFWPHSC